MILILLFLLSGKVSAQEAITLTAGSGSIPLEGHISWLRDTGGRLNPETAHAAPGWTPLEGVPNFGFTSDAIWLAFRISHPVNSQQSWRLEINNALLEDVRLYQKGPTGAWSEQRAGSHLPHSDWPAATRAPTFTIDPMPGTSALLVRLETRNAMSTVIKLWSADSFLDHALTENLAWGLYFGTYALVILTQCMFWFWTRERLSGWYVPYAILNFLGLFLTSGIPQNLLNLTAPLATPLLGALLCINTLIGLKYFAVLIELNEAMPKTHRYLLLGFGALTIAALLLVLSGHYAAGVQTIQITTLLIMLIQLAIALRLLVRGHAPARIFLYVFVFFYIGIAIRYLRNLGFLPAGILTDYSIQAGSLAHMVVMNLFIIYRYNALKQALTLEMNARQEQRDFVAMVSHEFRTPLAIISTSVQQLAANLTAPLEKSLRRCSNIQSAARRMDEMITNYLSSERMENLGRHIHRDQCRPAEILRHLAQDWPDRSIELVEDSAPETLRCDPELLQLALRNLLANADRYAPSGTPITLRSSVDGNYWHITVIDHGPGLKSDELPRIFQKYFRGSASQGKPGAGLGLFIVRNIIEAHGGTVNAQSREGQTMFTISIPTNISNGSSVATKADLQRRSRLNGGLPLNCRPTPTDSPRAD